MCELCNYIAKTSRQYREKRMIGGDFIFSDENDEFGILIDTGDSGCLGVLNNIKYCPICGRIVN